METHRAFTGLGWLMLLVCVGCSASGPLYEAVDPPADPGRSHLTVFRPDEFLAGGVGYRLFLDDEKLVTLWNNGYSRVDVPAGDHTVHISWWGWWAPVFSSALDIQAPGGGEVVVRVRPGFFSASLDDVSGMRAARRVDSARWIEPDTARF